MPSRLTCGYGQNPCLTCLFGLPSVGTVSHAFEVSRVTAASRTYACHREAARRSRRPSPRRRRLLELVDRPDDDHAAASHDADHFGAHTSAQAAERDHAPLPAGGRSPDEGRAADVRVGLLAVAGPGVTAAVHTAAYADACLSFCRRSARTWDSLMPPHTRPASRRR